MLEFRKISFEETVTIPACIEHEGYQKITVRLIWRCPVCGEPRGTISTVESYDGSRKLSCDGWINPCGHVDKYTKVVEEAKNNNLNN